jgi:hypothetical protein
MNEMHATADRCTDILKHTNDGGELAPEDLRLTELAINGHLNERGLQKLDELHRRVVAGEYTKPWFHGVEPMTHDHEGYVYYKDAQVEHYSSHYAYSLQAKRDLTELRDRCAYLERSGAEVSCGNAVWNWEKNAGAYGAEKQGELDRALAGGGVTYSKVAVDNNWNRDIQYFTPGVPDWETIRASPVFRDFYNRNGHDHGFEVSVRSYRYGSGKEVDDTETLAIILSCHDYLRGNGLLQEVGAQNYMIEPERENEDEAAVEQEDEDEMEGSL